jgi:two-component system OmpR family sensor kinase
MADHTRLHTVVANLLEDALTHTPEGGSVTVSVVRAGDDRVRLHVADTGPGIPPDQLPHIFERF